ncbi:MAG: sulfatase-like hydrolase/transferase [Candidatus Omnitrophota bacterium]
MYKRFNLMMMWIIGILFLNFSGAPLAGAPKVKTGQKDLNVLLISVDTLRYDRLSVYCNKYVKTPNIDQLASQSIVFTRAFTHNPCTLPAHTNILTGTTGLYHGIGDNSGFHLDNRFLTLPMHLKQAGYSTGAFIGAFPLDSRFGLNHGFDTYDDHYGTHNELELFFVERPAEKVIDPAIQWISKQKGKWFTWIHLFDPHQPYLPPLPYRKEYRKDLYSGEVAYMDACLKRLFDFLGDRGLMDRTLIILTADHGEALGEKGEETHAYFAYNNTIHIPLIVHIPGVSPGSIQENVCHTDIFPTVCHILGLKIPSHMQGESLVPIIEGGKRKRQEIYFESLSAYLNRGWAPLRGFIRGDTKFIDLPIPEVYHIKNDPGEDHNLASAANTVQLKRDLVKLKLTFKGPKLTERSQQVDASVRDKLKSLGYLTGSGPAPADKVFTAADDLKTMLPLQSRMLAALAKYQDGQFQDAVNELKAVAKASPGFALVYSHVATIYQDYGQIENAVSFLEEGLKKNPDNLALMSKLGIIQAESGKPERAIELLTYCTLKDSYNPDNFNYLGVACYKKGDSGKALENYRKVIQLSPDYAPAYNNIGTLYLATYLKKRDEASYQSAMENFNRALTIDPRLYSAYNGRGSAYMYKKNTDAALSDWKKVIEIKPDFIDAYFNIGITYFMAKKDKTSALKYYLICKDKYYTRLPVRERQRLDRLIKEVNPSAD